MAITCIPNQAVNFCTPSIDSCGCFASDWCTKQLQDNDSWFQVELSEATGTNLLSTDESTFNAGCGGVPPQWACGAKWAIAANVATYTPSGASTLSLDLGATLEVDTYYKFEFDITVGALGASFNVQIGGFVLMSGFAISANTAVQTITGNFYLDAKTDSLISFTPTGGNIDIENVRLVKMSMPEVLIKDDTGATVFTFAHNVYLSDVTNFPVTKYTLIETPGGGNQIQMILWDNADGVTVADIFVQWQFLSVGVGCFTICVNDQETAGELESNCFNVQTSFDCTHTLTWSNDSDHFGLVWSIAQGFGRMEIESRLYHPTFDNEGDLFTDDAGAATQTFAKKATVQVLQTEPLPEFLHDALSNTIIHDNFFIDGVEYVKRQGDYQPDWNKNYNLAPVRIEVSKQSNENIHNRSCS